MVFLSPGLLMMPVRVLLVNWCPSFLTHECQQITEPATVSWLHSNEWHCTVHSGRDQGVTGQQSQWNVSLQLGRSHTIDGKTQQALCVTGCIRDPFLAALQEKGVETTVVWRGRAGWQPRHVLQNWELPWPGHLNSAINIPLVKVILLWVKNMVHKV